MCEFSERNGVAGKNNSDDARVVAARVGIDCRPKKVVFENGHLAGMIIDALSDIAEEIIACDPTRNTLIATAEDSNDRNDARRMGLLARTGSLHPVYVPAEPYRTFRSLVCLETQLTRQAIEFMIRIKAFCRRHGIRYHRGKAMFLNRERAKTLEQLPSQAARAQMTALFRLLDAVRQERVEIRRELRRMTAHMPVIQRLQTIPGVGPIVARVLVAWIVDPGRFKSRNALSSYSGLGLKQNITNRKTPAHAHASRRGQRGIKRVLFLAARATIRQRNGFARRYQARIAAGWEDRKAIRDIARGLLFTICHVWRTGEAYDDARINVPEGQSAN